MACDVGGGLSRRAVSVWGCLCAAVLSAATSRAEEPLRVIAHRGGVVDERHNENSAAAIEAAVERGYWMVEVDVRESKDGHLVVHHDADFRRYYGDSRRLAEMTWEEIAALRATPGGTRPLEFHEVAALCRGRLRVMIDTKAPEHSDAFYAEMEAVLRENELLETAYFIGTRGSKAYFADKARTSINAEGLRDLAEGGGKAANAHFLFMHGRDMTAEEVSLGRTLGLPIVPSVNTFHYLGAKDHQARAEADIHRLRTLGVTEFQIDSPYDGAVLGPAESR